MKMFISTRSILTLILLPFVHCLTSEKLSAQVRNNTSDHSIKIDHNTDTSAIMTIFRRGRDIADEYPDSSIALLKTSLQLSTEANFAYGATSSLLQIGMIYSERGLYDESLAALREAITYSGQTEQAQNLMPLIYGIIAAVYQIQNNYEKAAYYYFRAILFAEKLPNAAGMDYTYSNMAGIFNIFGQPDLALSYLKKAEQIALEHKHMTILESALLNRGIIYITQEKWDEAMNHFQNTLYLGRKYNLPRAQHFALINIASLCLNNNQPDRALSYARESLKFTRNVNALYINGASITLG